MPNRVALAICVHHKPWLVMSTLITLLAQDFQDVDLFFLYNVGDGDAARPDAPSTNTQLSPFDERVREVCRLRRGGVFEIDYVNDEALDSGAWYKFIRSERWRSYEWTLFLGEGTLFARSALLSAMLSFAAWNPQVHLVASGHEQRRIPKNAFLKYRERHERPTDRDRLEDRMIEEAFAIFSRDPSFRRLFDAWGSDFPAETQNHVPEGGPPSDFLRRLRSRWIRTWGPPASGGALSRVPWTVEYPVARLRLFGPPPARNGSPAPVYVNGAPRLAESVADITRVDGVGFHRVDGPEWFGCTPIQLMSRTFLERFHARLEEFRIWDTLDLCYSGTPLEVIWGFIPRWLGFEKWFTDGFHRVRKDYATYAREDSAPEMAAYIDRYYRGHLAVTWRGDFLRIGAYRSGLERLRDQLPAAYF
jgi:hypothetical protein